MSCVFATRTIAWHVIILLAYLIVAAIILGVLDHGPEATVPADTAKAAAMAIPIGAVP